MPKTVEPRWLHRRFWHPLTDKLMKPLRRSEVENFGSETHKALENIERACARCLAYTQKLQRFKFTLRDNTDFSHTLYANMFHIEEKPILPEVDGGTYCHSARSLLDMSFQTVWKALPMCWIRVPRSV